MTDKSPLTHTTCNFEFEVDYCSTMVQSLSLSPPRLAGGHRPSTFVVVVEGVVGFGVEEVGAELTLPGKTDDVGVENTQTGHRCDFAYFLDNLHLSHKNFRDLS